MKQTDLEICSIPLFLFGQVKIEGEVYRFKTDSSVLQKLEGYSIIGIDNRYQYFVKATNKANLTALGGE